MLAHPRPFSIYYNDVLLEFRKKIGIKYQREYSVVVSGVGIVE